MICIGLYPILFNFKSIIILEHIISISEQYEYFLSKDMEIVYMLLACFVNIFFYLHALHSLRYRSSNRREEFRINILHRDNTVVIYQVYFWHLWLMTDFYLNVYDCIALWVITEEKDTTQGSARGQITEKTTTESRLPLCGDQVGITIHNPA